MNNQKGSQGEKRVAYRWGKTKEGKIRAIAMNVIGAVLRWEYYSHTTASCAPVRSTGKYYDRVPVSIAITYNYVIASKCCYAIHKRTAILQAIYEISGETG